MKKLKIGLIDSGCNSVECTGAFINVTEEHFVVDDLKEDIHGHGSVLAKLISPDYATFICAQVFDESLRTTAQTVAYAFEYLIEHDVDLIHVSLGLSSNIEVLQKAVSKAVNKGITIVASSPALSQYQTFPAAYSGVIAVTSDARCKEDNISYINTSTALFGASPFCGSNTVRGSSVSAAYVTKALAKLHYEGVLTWHEQLEYLKKNAVFKIAQAQLSKGLV